MPHHSDKAFLLKSLSTSLHCNTPLKDALYDVQLVPDKLQRGPTILWSVYAQYSRNNEPFKWSTKCKNKQFSVAHDEYLEVLLTRTGHGYRAVPRARESDLQGKLSLAYDKVASGLPTWDSYKDFFLSVTAYLTSASAPVSSRVTSDLLITAILADVAYSLPEGITEAVAKVKSCSQATLLRELLSPEIQAWMQSQLAAPYSPNSQDMFERAFDDVYAVCAAM